MTNPFAFQNGGVVPGQGDGATMAQGLAGVLAQMQQQRENQYRMQELQTQQAQQQALQQYYQGQNQNQAAEQARLTGQWQAGQQAQAQVGSAQRAAMGQDPNAGLFHQVLAGGAQAMPPGISSVFTGVSDSNMPAAVKGVQEVQELQPKTPELPTSGKEFEYYNRLQQTDPKRAAIYKTLFLDPKPTTTINNIPAQGESEFSKEFAKAQVATLTSGEKEARQSVQAYPAMKEAYGLVDKSFTGFGANQLLGLARIAGQAGFKPSKDRVADTQTLLKLTRDQTLAYLQTRALGSGTAVSDRDREFMERQSAADITLDPNSIKRIIRINVGTGIMRMQEAIADLRDQSIAYPINAVQLNAKADALAKMVAPIWKNYSEMLKAEGDEITKTGNSLFPARSR